MQLMGSKQLINGLCFRYRRTYKDLILKFSWFNTVDLFLPTLVGSSVSLEQ